VNVCLYFLESLAIFKSCILLLNYSNQCFFASLVLNLRTCLVVRINSLESSLRGLASQLVMLTSTLAPLMAERMVSREKQSEIGER